MARVDRAAMKQLIDRVYGLNDTYERLLGMQPDQQLGPPAAESEIDGLEARLGVSLPPTYRTFLSLHDGWKSFQAEISLLSIREQLEGEAAEYIQSWKRDKWADAATVVLTGVVIGVAIGEGKGYILDTDRTDDRGEMEIVYWNLFETERYSDFMDLLSRKAQYMEEFIAEERKKA